MPELPTTLSQGLALADHLIAELRGFANAPGVPRIVDVPLAARPRAAEIADSLLETSFLLRSWARTAVASGSLTAERLPKAHRRAAMFLLELHDELSTLHADLFWEGHGRFGLAGAMIGDLRSDLLTDFIHFCVQRAEGVWTLQDEDYPFSENEERLALGLINANWFKPSEWIDNQRMVRPVFVARDSRIPAHVLIRLEEISRSCVFGNWLAAIALCRSVIEYAIVNCSDRMGFEVSVDLPDGRVLQKTLSELISEASDRIPEIEEPAKEVARIGNEALHPRRKRYWLQEGLRDRATACLNATWTVLENLYDSR